MKTLLRSSILLLLFSCSLLVFNLSCKKESTAQNTSTSTQNLGILVFEKLDDKVNEFWTSKYDGSGQIKITVSSLPANTEIVKESIKISPDGKKFFLVVYTRNTSDLYSCNSDGTGLTKLIDNVGDLTDIK
jgi:hypothetical protein